MIMICLIRHSNAHLSNRRICIDMALFFY